MIAAYCQSWRRIVLLAAIAWGCQPADTPPPVPRFHEAAAGHGLVETNVSGSSTQDYIVETMSVGVALVDIDDDADLDLFLVSGTRFEGATFEDHPRLYVNEAADSGATWTRRFRDVSVEAGIAQPGWGMGAAAADIDNDGLPELFASHWGADRLYANQGSGRFIDIASAAGVADEGWSSSAAFGDLDGDGLVDLYVTRYLHFDRDDPPGGEGRNCHYKGLPVFCGPRFIPPQHDRLYRNVEGRRFEDMSQKTGIDAVALPSMGVTLVDLDEDGDLDVYVANDSEPNLLYRNDGRWRLREISTTSGVAYSEDGRPQAGMGVAAGDVDGDLDPDLVVTNFADDTNTLYRNMGGLQFRDVTHEVGIGGVARPLLGWSALLFDVDLDGTLDLFIANGHLYPQLRAFEGGLQYEQPNLLYLNRNGRFEQSHIIPAPGERKAASRAAAFGDIDNDGDLDLVVGNMNQPPALLINELGSPRWIGLELRGTDSPRTPIGARATLHQGGRRLRRIVLPNTGFQSSSDPRLVFGLAGGAPVDSIVIDWPSGRPQTLTDLTLNRYLLVEEGMAPVARPAVSPSPRRAVGQRPAQVVASVAEPLQVVEADDPQQSYALGKRLYGEGRYEEALAAFRSALAATPQDLSSRVNIAVTLFMGLGRREEAAAELRQAIADHPRRYEPRLWLGKLELHGGDLDTALVSLHDAIALAPLDGESYHWLGIGLMRADSLEAARVALERAVRLTPHHPRPHLTLAGVLDRMGKAEQARRRRAVYQRLLKLQNRVEEYEYRVEHQPGNARLVSNLASAYARQRRFTEAESQFRQAIALDPDYAGGAYGLGLVLLTRGRHDEAAAVLRDAIRSDPSMIAAHNALGQAHHAAARYDSAIAAFERALSLDPASVPVLINLALSQQAAGRPAEAESAWRRVLEAAPDNRRARVWLEQNARSREGISEGVAP